MTINDQRAYYFTVIGVGTHTLVPIPALSYPAGGGEVSPVPAPPTSLSFLPPFILRLLISSS